MADVRHLHLRGGAYYYSRRVPARVRHLVPKERVRVSIGLARRMSLDDAERKVAEIDRDHERAWDALLQGERVIADEHFARAASMARLFGFPMRSQADILANETEAEKDRRLGELMSITPEGQEPATDAADGLLGGVDLAEISRRTGDVADSETLSWAYAADQRDHGAVSSVKHSDLALRLLIEAVGDIPIAQLTHRHALDFKAALEARGNSARTISRRLDPLSGIWRRWKRHHPELLIANPFEGVRPRQVKASKADRLPFHLVHFEIIDRGNFRPQAAAQIALMRATGIGEKELAGLDPDQDIVLDHPIPHIHVQPNARRSLKSGDPRERRIPLVGISHDLVRAAVVQVYEDKAADNMSAKLCKALRVAGVPKSPRLTAYSFRHSFKQALRESGALKHLADELMGHSGETGSAGVYGSDGLLAAKRNALVEAQRWLGLVEVSRYSAAELPPALRRRAFDLDAERREELGLSDASLKRPV